jgi:hypothetical protein
MRITHIETYKVRVPLRPERRMISALGRHEVSDYVLVRLIADSGLEGGAKQRSSRAGAAKRCGGPMP